MRRVALVVAISLAGSAGAQSGLKPNQMVKVELATHEIVRGKVLERTTDSLVLSDYSRVIALAKQDILSVATYDREWSRGAKRGAKVGAIIGGIAVVAGLVTDLTYCRSSSNECMAPATVLGVGAALYTTGMGAGIGLITAPGGWSKPRPY